MLSKERISSTELFALMTMFLIGSTIIMPKGAMAGHDSWLAVVLATGGGLLVAWMYTTLCATEPRRSLLELGETWFGRWGGKLVALLYAWYAFHLGTLVLKNVEQLTTTVLLPQTPTLLVDLTLILLVMWATRGGIEVIGRCALVIFGVFFVYLLLTSILMIPDMDPQHLLPILDRGLAPVFEATAKITSFPFGETILFAMVLPFVNKQKQVKKTTFWAIGISGFFLLIDDVRNVVMFGELMSEVNFPSYTSVAFISIADFLERIEPFGFLVWVLAGFVKISICLHVSAQCVAQLIGSQEYRPFVMPLTVLMLELAQFIYKSQAEMIDFANQVWMWYSLPFQFVIPLLLLAAIVIRRKRQQGAVTK